jgi:hypothetical protein
MYKFVKVDPCFAFEPSGLLECRTLIQAFYKSHVGYIRMIRLNPLSTPFIDILKIKTFCPTTCSRK